MKVIDLLNKIANGEAKYPIKWKCYGSEYEIENETNLVDFHCMYNKLNDEIEIIEEPQQIKKCDVNINTMLPNGANSENEAYIMTCIQTLGNDLNSLIDYINENK